MKILVTGSEGLVGRTLCPLLKARGHEAVYFDLVHGQDVTDYRDLTDMVVGNRVDGIIHLAAVSRVVWGQQDPGKCASVNIDGTLNVLRAAEHRRNTWVLFTSSREVYGFRSVSEIPVVESDARRPHNVYALTKALGEELVGLGRVPGGIVRLSNVYGDTADHADRVTPAFARAAAFGTSPRLRGGYKTFDFVHVKDAALGLALAAEKLWGKGSLPTIHLATGVGTSLEKLARLAVDLGAAPIKEDPLVLDYEVSGFVGDPTRAGEVLGWKAEIRLEDGFKRLVEDFRRGEVNS